MDLQTVLKINREKEWARKKALLKKEQRKEKILTFFIGSFLVVTTIMLLVANVKYDEVNLEKCIKKGFAQNVCEANL